HAWGTSLLVPDRLAPGLRCRATGGPFHAHRPGSAADRSRAAETLWRHRAGGSLADRGAGRARARCDAVCERGFPDFGHARADVAEGVTPRRFDPRSQCAAYDDARARASARRGVRLPAFPPRLLSVLVVFAPADPVHHHAARPARSAGAPAGFQHLLLDPGGVDLERTAPSGAASRLG